MTVQPMRFSLLAAGDDRDARGQRPHRVAERGAVGVMKTAFAHARASINRSRAPCVRDAGAGQSLREGLSEHQ